MSKEKGGGIDLSVSGASGHLGDATEELDAETLGSCGQCLRWLHRQ